jgi:uncharacterized membrane protein
MGDILHLNALVMFCALFLLYPRILNMCTYLRLCVIPRYVCIVLYCLRKILVYRGGIRFKVMHACCFVSQQRAHPPSLLRVIIMTCGNLLLGQDSTLI